ncbi:MAG: GAF domain-containing protein [Gaiellaceae bacterium]
MKEAAETPYAEQLEQLRQLRMLLSLSQRVAALDSVDAVLETLLQAAIAEIGADRGSIFLHDRDTAELYTYAATGLGSRQIRLMDDLGIAGAVFHGGVGEIVHDAYADPRFHRDVDGQTDYLTKSLVCAPIRNARGDLIGVAEVLNKLEGEFGEADLDLLEGMTSQCAVTLEALQRLERMSHERQREVDFLNIVSDLTSELELATLLERVVSEATRMLDCDRTTLFLNDEKTGELFSYVVDKLELKEIRFPNHLGIAGTVFTAGHSIRIPYAYADLRFNPAFDRQSGYFTRCVLCVPIFNKEGKAIGVTQSLNKRGGAFTPEDESRLRAFTAQVASALENAKLFSDVQAMRNYNAAMLESMSNGVITFDEDGRAGTCNTAASRILRLPEEELVGRPPEEVFRGTDWLVERIHHVAEARTTELAMDVELTVDGGLVSANVTVLPLHSSEDAQLGTLVMIEDISSEKRVKSTLARYMDPDLADRLLAAGPQEGLLGGNESLATVLFSDIRSFTTLAEQLGASATVTLLNEYFERMVECISQQGGMLDKFIGDAIMAAFGLPEPRPDDEDRALRAAIAMIQSLRSWNRERRQRGEPELDMGVGLNTDIVVAGNIGSPKRMDYTIIGDGVNLASRLESACKHYGARILLSERTQTKLRGVYRLREVDRVIVKGKTEPVAVFECLDYHDAESFPNVMEAVGAFGEGLASYREASFDAAREWFERALKANPADRLAALYRDQSQAFLESPPPPGWDGTSVLAEK